MYSKRPRDIGSEMNRDAGDFRFRALGFRYAVEEQLNRCVSRDNRDPVSFKNAEIGAATQVVALPCITVKHEAGDIGLRHGREKSRAPCRGQRHFSAT